MKGTWFKSIIEWVRKLVKGKPNKGVPKASKDVVKVEQVQPEKVSVLQKAVGTGGKILSNVW